MTAIVEAQNNTDTASTAETEDIRPILSTRYALGWRHVLATVCLGVFFMYLNYMPLFHSDIWGHVHYGKWMLEHGRLVDEDPFMPLAVGMHAVNNAWLSQLLLAKLYEIGGPHYLSNLFALVGLSTYLIYFRIYYQFTGRVLAATAGCALLLFVGWSRHAIIRPEIFGNILFAALLWMIMRIEPWRSRAIRFQQQDEQQTPAVCPRWLWFAVPALFVLWVNLHGSYAVGLLLLAGHAGGRAIEVLWQTRRLGSLFTDSLLRTWVLLTEVSVLATLVNPYGIDMLIETATFGRNPNLRDILEWYPLKLIALEGLQFSASLLLLFFLVRHSRERFTPTDVLLLFAFAAMIVPTIRMIAWYAPVFAFAAAPHIGNILNRLFGVPEKVSAGPMFVDPDDSKDSPHQAGHTFQFAGTLGVALAIWCAFSFAPISSGLLGGKPRRPDQIYSKMTPFGVTEFLKKNPTTDLVFGPQWWGDWLAWAAPGTKVFMTTHIHLAPKQVWNDYLRIARGQVGWNLALDRYDVQMIVADKDLQKLLVRQLRGMEQWKIVYEDKLAVVAKRVKTASAAEATPAKLPEAGEREPVEPVTEPSAADTKEATGN